MSCNENGFSFVWKVENFSMLPHQLGEYLDSPMFVVDAWKDAEFCLRLFPRGNKTEGCLSLYLEKEPADLDLKLNFNLAVESADPSKEILQQTKDHVLKEDWGFPMFMKLDDLYAKNNYYLPQNTLTIRCEISPAEQPSTELNVNQDSNSTSMFLLKHCVTRTHVQVQRRSVMWSIWNVKERMQRRENASILLKSALKNSPSLKLTLHFNKSGSSEDIPIIIRQTKISPENERLFVKCKITVTSVDDQYKCQTSQTSSHLFKSRTSDEWTFPSFLTTDMLTDKTFLKGVDTLFLQSDFAFSNKSGVHHSENNSMPFNSFEARPKKSEMSTCFEDLYGSGKFCDVELKADGRSFPYYKAVLCARSPVFTAMFEDNMRERESNVVEIEDVDPDTLQRMLTYMLSDILQEDLSPEDAFKLYLVADKYDLPSLKKRCSILLATTVYVPNACELLVLADAHMDNFLLAAVADFICGHAAAEVLHSSQWATFMEDNTKLSCKLMHKMMIGKF